MNSLRVLFVLQAFFMTSVVVTAQSLDFSVREVIVTTPDSLIKASIWNKPNNRKINPSYHYYWYYSGAVNHNVGGFTGKLLHGKYEVFDNQQKLMVQGVFEHGLMTGIWHRWYPNGNVQFMGTFKNGMLQGEAKTFTKEGAILTSMQFNEGLLHGKSLFFYKDTIIVKRYKYGREVIKKKKQPCRIFKKQAETSKAVPPKEKAKQVKPSAVKQEQAKPNEKAKKPWWHLSFLKKGEKTKAKETKTVPTP